MADETGITEDIYDLDEFEEEQLLKDLMFEHSKSKEKPPEYEEKQNLFTFFKKIISDTSKNIKTAFLKEEELGFAKIPVRTNLEISEYCKAMGNDGFSKYFENKAQIVLGTSLSRDGFIDKLAVTQKRESAFRTRIPVTQRRGFFTRREEGGEMQ